MIEITKTEKLTVVVDKDLRLVCSIVDGKPGSVRLYGQTDASFSAEAALISQYGGGRREGCVVLGVNDLESLANALNDLVVRLSPVKLDSTVRTGVYR